MNLKTLYTQYLGLAAMALALCLVSCERDGNEDLHDDCGLPFSLSTYMNETTTAAATRALPGGYSEFKPSGNVQESQIAVFMTTTDNDGKSYSEITGTFNYMENGDWKTYLGSTEKPLPVGQVYYMYGFMPASAATDSSNIVSSAYDAGATMRICGVNPVSGSDVCAIVGVASSTASISVGAYSYTPQYNSESKQENPVAVLLDHLFSRVEIMMSTTDSYRKLRRVKITGMTLSSPVHEGKLSVTMDGTGVNSVSFTPGTDAASTIDMVLSSSGDSVLTGTLTTMSSFYCPKEVSAFTLTTNYDVYSADGSKVIRSGQKAVNNISMTQTFDRGVSYKLNMQVAPAFLYRLTEDDLDNPQMTVITQ